MIALTARNSQSGSRGVGPAFLATINDGCFESGICLRLAVNGCSGGLNKTDYFSHVEAER